METSASAPVIHDSDYYVPCHGVGLTGHANRTTHGAFARDTGQHSSRINQIVKQASKYPGPSTAHKEWDGQGGFKFANGTRDWKFKAKVPDFKERDDIFTNVSNASKDCVSKNPRILHGKVPKGRRRSFLDAAEKKGKESMPYYTSGNVCANKLDTKHTKLTLWDKEKEKHVGRQSSRKDSTNDPNGNAIISWSQAEERVPNYTWPKESGSNFLDRAVREKMLPGKGKEKMPTPGPGECYKVPFDHSKTSRGTFHLQLRGLSRSPASGYF
mmetsp:Transcript_70890/g.196963  ORF Transcript_70890/g.196963 Transcript_70890/m.196963 type:complete len:270 (+) Transcript_70890:71-880(+)